MTHDDVCHALMMLRPGAQWNLRGEDVSTIEWLDKVQMQPTEEEIRSAAAAYVPPLTLQEKIDKLAEQVKILMDAKAPQ